MMNVEWPCGLLLFPTDLTDLHRCRSGCFYFPTDRALGAADGTDFFAGAFNGHAPKGQKSIAQRQAKQRPGYNVAVQVAPCKGKSADTERVTFTFALTGRGVMWRFTQGVASLALGYGGHWAFSPPWAIQHYEAYATCGTTLL